MIFKEFGQKSINNKWRQYLQLFDVKKNCHHLKMKDIPIPKKQNQRQDLDIYWYDILKNCSNVFYTGDAHSRDDVCSPPTFNDFFKVSDFFSKNEARRFKFISKSQPQSYFCFGHTDLLKELQCFWGFIPYYKYPSQKDIFPYEVGRIADIRIILKPEFNPYKCQGVIETTNLNNRKSSTKSITRNVYPLIFIAQDSYGIDLDSNNVVILNQDWIIRLECSVQKFDD